MAAVTPPGITSAPPASGQQIGHYQLVVMIGKGGMGEVYRARDTRLNREVALKVLPQIFANDPNRMARFQREAQLLASLNDPKIAAIYGLEESGSIRALVMELVEGPTLADRIANGPIPFDETLPLVLQMADALAYAHDKGIIHRDLKPRIVFQRSLSRRSSLLQMPPRPIEKQRTKRVTESRCWCYRTTSIFGMDECGRVEIRVINRIEHP